MEFHILTIFPQLFTSPLETSVVKRALARDLISVHLHNIRDFTNDPHRVTDDAPYGGGAGMIMKLEPIVAGIHSIVEQFGPAYRILLSPQGKPLTQHTVKMLAAKERLLLICGRYGGIDSRIEAYIDTEISIGDFVVTGGELPALLLLDAVARLVPGVLGDWQSVEDDSLFNGLLQGPQYTRPANFAGQQVPDVLLSGDHKAITQWRRQQSLYTTWQRRPDLLQEAPLTPQDLALIREWQEREAATHGQ